MATRKVFSSTILTDYTQAQEDIFAATLTGKGQGWAQIFNTSILPLPGAIRVWNGSAFETVSAIPPALLPTLSTFVTIQDDFIGSALTNQWTSTILGVGASVAAIGTTPCSEAHPGVISMSPGTTSTGAATIDRGANKFANVAAGGVIIETWHFWIQLLSTVAQEYVLRVGLGDTTGSTDNANGVYFEYDRATSGGVWRIKTAKAGARTTTVSAAAVTAGWNTLKTVIQNGTIEYFVNGVSAGTITTNIPIACVGSRIALAKTVGTSARLIMPDFFQLDIALATAR